jgi:hypothetical protein
MPNDLTIIYYTSNYLEKKNPYFVGNTKKQLIKAAAGLPIISVSQEPMDFGTKNVCLGDIGRSHLNIYRQILEGCKNASTEFVAMAEDDVLYSWEHFHSDRPNGEEFLYDMNKVSIFTWTKPPMFSFRTKRRVVNHLIAPRTMLIEALEERFNRLEVLKMIMIQDRPEVTPQMAEQKLIKYWGDPGRYEDILGVTVRKTKEFYSTSPGIVFSHEFAFGYENGLGSKKRLGDLRILELDRWGRAEDILKLFYE